MKLLNEEIGQVAPRDPFNTKSWHLISLPGDANINFLIVHQERHKVALDSELCAINHLGHGPHSPQTCPQINKGAAGAREMGSNGKAETENRAELMSSQGDARSALVSANVTAWMENAPRHSCD